MKIITKIVLTGLVVLDVASFNACGQPIPKKKENAYIFLDPYHNTIYKKKFCAILEEPKVEYEGYELKYWYMYRDEDKTKVEFPYRYNEDDVIYYYYGKRNVIIFEGEWEKLEG